MKARVLFGVFGFAFVLLALYVFPPIVLELVVAALCVFATYEVLGSTKLVRNHLELLLAMAVSLGLAVGHFSILPLRLESVMQGLVLVLLFGSFAIELKYHDVMKASHDGKLEEVFGTGTAAVVSPVKELVWKGEHAYIGDGKIGPVTQKLYDTMTGMQWGKIPDTKGWIVPVEKKY